MLGWWGAQSVKETMLQKRDKKEKNENIYFFLHNSEK